MNGVGFRESYRDWYGGLALYTETVLGVSVEDLPDMPFRDWYSSGLSVPEAFDALKARLRENGYEIP